MQLNHASLSCLLGNGTTRRIRVELNLMRNENSVGRKTDTYLGDAKSRMLSDTKH